MKGRHHWPLTLGFHPTSRGFGWVAFEGLFAPYDWGAVRAKRDKNSVCLRALEKLLKRLQPETLVIEAYGRRTSLRSERIGRLCKAAGALAKDRGVDVAVFSRADIQACFADVGAKTRQEIANAVARHIDALRHRLPRRRRPWEPEDPRMALFSAAALVLTHCRYSALTFLNDMRDRSA